MSKLGSVSAKECTKALVVVPNHKQLATGTLHNIIKDAGLTVDEFKKLLR